MARKKAATKSDIDEELDLIRQERDNILNFKLNVKCKTKKQKEFFKSILEKEVTLALAPAGCGKSYISIFAALQLLKDPSNGYEKVIFVYPPELDKTEALGYTKGFIEEKIAVYTDADRYTMSKIFKASGQKNPEDIIQKLISSGQIEFLPSTYLRGRSFDRVVLLICEAQNFTKDSFLKILTRIGENSKYVISADMAQVDAQSIKTGKNIMGLQYAMEKLADLPEFGIIKFGLEDILRNDLIVKILKRWSPEIYGDLDEEEEFRKAQEEKLDE